MKIIEIPKERVIIPEKYKEIFSLIDASSEMSLIVAGGAIRDILFKNNISDVDFFASSSEILDQFKDVLIKNNYKNVYDKDKLKTFKKDDVKVQLIYHHYFVDVGEVFDRVDFTMCQFAYANSVYYSTVEALLDAKDKRLIFNTITKETTLDTMRRMIKYVKKDYNICAKELSKLAKACSILQEKEIEDQSQFYPDGSLSMSTRFD